MDLIVGPRLITQLYDNEITLLIDLLNSRIGKLKSKAIQTKSYTSDKESIRKVQIQINHTKELLTIFNSAKKKRKEKNE